MNNYQYKRSKLAILLKVISIAVVIGYVVYMWLFLMFGDSINIIIMVAVLTYALITYALGSILQYVYEIKQLQEYNSFNQDKTK
ncbi:MAG: hypothetical protein Q4C64_04910 [Erysipelotrichia bacterium]|nr:hypothetical protein [Erysipelotrichia bacterium]